MLSPPPTPPPPPPPPLPKPLFPLEDSASSDAVRDHHSYSPSILIIAAIVAAAIIAAASIHLLLRVISRSRSPPFDHHLASTSSSPSSSSSSSAPSSPCDQDPKSVIDSLPIFLLSSSTAKLSSSTSLDCAVCLSPFQLSDELRLLPACRHAFHSQCIDTWLKSSLSCPLCRSQISPVAAAPPPPPPADSSRSESFRVEIGSVSRRNDDHSAVPTSPHARSYSLGSSFEYVVEEEIEAVLARVRRRPQTEKSSEIQQAPQPPGEQLAELAGGSHRSWLRDYVDRLASSASSSFSSLGFSQRGTHRFDSTVVATGCSLATGGESWDLERNLHLHLEEEDGGFSAFYRWLVGA